MAHKTILEPEFVHATIRVREGKLCAGMTIADTVSEYANQVDIQHSESTGDGWRQVLAFVPSDVAERNLETFKKYPSVIKNWRMLWLSKASQNVILMEVMDNALNDVMSAKGSFQRIMRYTATPKYEEFKMIVFPVYALTEIIDTLSRNARANIIAQNTKPLDELEQPAFKTGLFRVPKLTPEEDKVLQVAFDLGWFEYPRPTGASVAQIGEKINMSPSATDIRLRAISRKLCREYFERYGQTVL